MSAEHGEETSEATEITHEHFLCRQSCMEIYSLSVTGREKPQEEIKNLLSLISDLIIWLKAALWVFPQSYFCLGFHVTAAETFLWAIFGFPKHIFLSWCELTVSSSFTQRLIWAKFRIVSFTDDLPQTSSNSWSCDLAEGDRAKWLVW